MAVPRVVRMMVRIQRGYVVGEETLGLVLSDTPLGELSQGSV